MNFTKNLQIRFNKANIVEKLIYINISIFILVFVFNTVGFLFKNNQNIVTQWFALPADVSNFLSKPWTIITYGFLHVNFIHILVNLVALFYIGNLFLEYFIPKQLLNFYIFGTIFGGIIFILSYNYFPALSQSVNDHILLGASAGISTVFIGISTYIPQYQLKFRFIGFVHLWKLAVLWIALDVIQIPMGNNAGGHLAHLGGALFGFLYVKQMHTIKVNPLKKFKSVFKTKSNPLKTVYKSNEKTNSFIKKEQQKKIDIILDKIGKSGYNALTKEEKSFLFEQGKNK